MHSDEREDSFLLDAFRQFYAEVLRFKAAIQRNPWGITRDGSAPEQDAALRAEAAERVASALQNRLRRQAAEAGRRGGDWGALAFHEAKFAMATLADEVFLELPWEGRQVWASNLLETRVFGSYVGGEKLFAEIDALLEGNDPTRRPLAEVYLMALSLGFKGRYAKEPEVLERYRQRLFAFVYPSRGTSARAEGRLFAQAYAHTATDAPPERLPPTRRWLTAMAAAVLLYLVVSHGFWRTAARGVEESARAVDGMNAQAAEPGR